MATPAGLLKPYRLLALLPVLLGLALEVGAFAMTVHALEATPEGAATSQMAAAPAPSRSM